MRKRITFIAVTLTVLLVMSAPTWAQSICDGVAGNLVVNCGFEAGDFTGWTQSGNTGFTGVTSIAPYVNSGTYGAYLGPVGSDGYLSQTIWGNTWTFAFRQDPAYWGLDDIVVTFAGSCGAGCALFDASFYLYNDGGTPNDFTVYLNGVDVGPDLVDVGNFPYIQYVGSGFQGSTPEPSSLILMGSGLLGLAGVARRKLGV
ncbi:MAG TPA: PEP-CTERM sorting domain-containing protein [Candidatus Eisenbacteria bacterium]|nr:PEP-CTERM sorting domain-containing protein [Candidatus Eisenbacteria bacterium]